MHRVLVTVAVLALAGAAQAQGKGKWLPDPKTGCKYFDNDPEPGESIKWAGPCKNGVVEGRGHLDVYVKGKLDQQYDGDMKAGTASGQGTIRLLSSGETYVGSLLNNVRNGHGVTTWSDGGRFEGEYANDLRNGHGIATLADGSRFEGEYRNDVPEGQGTLVRKGETFSGNWVHGCFRDGNRTAWVNTTKEACGFK